MIWAIAAAGGIGLLFGAAALRVPVLLIGSVAILSACWGVAPFSGLPLVTVAALSFFLLCVFQFAYLAGLMLSCAWTRAIRPQTGILGDE